MAKAKTKPKSKKTHEPEAKKKKPRRYSDTCNRWRLSKELQAVVGVPVSTKSGLIKMVWQYIKDNRLQDPEDKRYFYPDRLLLPIVGSGRLRVFQFSKYLGKHLTFMPLAQDDKKFQEEAEARFTGCSGSS